MHPLIMITSSEDGLLYGNGSYLGEIRQDAPVFRPIAPFGAIALQMHPFHPMALSCTVRAAFSSGKLVGESFREGMGATAVSWPFGITEIHLDPRKIHTLSPVVKTITGAGKTFKYIKTPASACLETEFQGRISVHALPCGALEPVLAEGEGTLYVSGDSESGDRYALALTQTGEHMLLSVTGRKITFLPGSKIRVISPVGDLAGHEREDVYQLADTRFEKISSRISPNPDQDFRAVTPVECALMAAQAVIFHLEDVLASCLFPKFTLDEQTKQIIESAYSAVPLRFTPPDGRSAIAVLKRITPVVSQAVPIYYRAEIESGEWKIIDMKA